MKLRKKTGLWVLRLFVYTGLALMLWLRFRATNSVQRTVMSILVLLALVTINYYLVRFLIRYATSPKRPLTHPALPLL